MKKRDDLDANEPGPTPRSFKLSIPLSHPTQDKTVWQHAGWAYEQKDGSIRARLRVVPVQPWDGVLVLFPIDYRGGSVIEEEKP